jgi:hypothetical protein
MTRAASTALSGALTRRSLLGLAAASAMTMMAGCGPSAEPVAVPREMRLGGLPALFDDLERRTFAFFWDTTNPRNGLVPDRWPNVTFSSIAAVGFALTAYPIGVTRGYITREQARERTLTTLRFFAAAPQGDAATGTSGNFGFFYRYLDMETGTRSGDVEVSTVDTALLLSGMLFAQQWFDGNDAGEAEIRRLVDDIYARVDWRRMQPRPPTIVHGWTPEEGFMLYDWRGYNEGMVLYLLALASPTSPVDADAWGAWTQGCAAAWGRYQDVEHLCFAPMFGHQYTHVWFDFRGIQDEFMRQRQIDFFENSRRATLTQRAYAIANPEGWRDYGPDIWGLTACDGPGRMMISDHAGRPRAFSGYLARGASRVETADDGTIAPTAAAASLPFAPDVVVPCVQAMHQRYGEVIYGKYGFFDAFNRSFIATGATLEHGRVVPDFGWVDTDYLGIDQGPILAMIENHRSDLVWATMRKHPVVRLGLQRAGFRGGWLG